MDDALEIKLMSRKSPLERGADGVVELLRVIDAHAGPLAPEHIYDKRLITYSHAAVAERVTQARGPRLVHLMRTADPEVSITLQLGRSGPLPFGVRARVPLNWIAQAPDARSRVVIDFVRAMAAATACSLGWAHPDADVVAAPGRHDPYQLEDSHWLDVLGPDLIASIGRERVESTPVHVRVDFGRRCAAADACHAARFRERRRALGASTRARAPHGCSGS